MVLKHILDSSEIYRIVSSNALKFNRSLFIFRFINLLRIFFLKAVISVSDKNKKVVRFVVACLLILCVKKHCVQKKKNILSTTLM